MTAEEEFARLGQLTVEDLTGGECCMNVVRTDAEIDRVEAFAYAGMEEGSRYPSMSYEQGLLDMLDWLRGRLPLEGGITDAAPPSRGLRGTSDHAPDEDD